MDSKMKQKIDPRLARIEGQVRGIRAMVRDDRYCVDILTQLSAVVSALKKVEELVLENHLNTCVSDAIRQGDEEKRSIKISEVMDVFASFRRQ
ncbi:MAG: metal-sensitive transcriptional regulator [Sphaerochaeta sp.]|jgi:DNA-binding FrmR family transcriptional regulator|nr:MAG: metal-sensitive transcriptional regulator [Sphaerochaeta sp.]